MNKLIAFLVSVLLLFPLLSCDKGHKDYINESKQECNERMAWWRDARFGMFIHWGIYSVPAGVYQGQSGHAEWIMNTANIPIEEYEQYASQFNPTKFNAQEWVNYAKNAGMRYLVITSKHHDGFCLWNSKVSDYDIIDRTSFKRDVLQELSEACKKEGIKLCFYHSIMDWHHPYAEGENFSLYRENYLKPQLQELVTNYGPLGVLWFDGEWIPEWTEDQGKELYNFVRNLQADIIINNRVGKGRAGMQGMNKYKNAAGDFGTPEQEILESASDYDWESCMTMNDHWGYASYDKNWKSATTLIRNLIDIASKGGNYLLNVGPTSEGLFPKQSVKILQEMGHWMSIHGESIYGTLKSPFSSTPWGRSTMKKIEGKTILYLHVFEWPSTGMLTISGLGSHPTKITTYSQPSKELEFTQKNEELHISIPTTAPNSIASVIALEFSEDVVVFHPPKLSTVSDIFVDTVIVELSVPSKQLDIYYTLDGTTPDVNSNTYQGPLFITNSSTVRAQTFFKDRPVSEIVEKKFSKVKPQSAATITEYKLGLNYDYYEGEWDELPDFYLVNKKATGVVDTLNLSKRQVDEKFAMRFYGYFEVVKDDVYIFSLTSDDGSQLFIDNQLLIDNDGLHGLMEKQGRIALAKGKHAILVTYFNKLGGRGLDLQMAAIDEEKRPIQLLFHTK